MTTLVTDKPETVQPATGHDLAKRSLAKSISAGTLTGIFANLVRFGTRLFLVPIFINHLGLGGYGIWATLMVISGYLRFGAAGVKGCFQKYVAEATGDGNFERANQLVSTGSAIFFVLSVAVLVPAAFLSRYIAHLAGIPQQYLSASATAISLLAVAYLISNSVAVFESAVLGAHRVDITRRFNVGFLIFEAVYYITVLRLGFGLRALGAGMAMSELGYAISCCIVARRVIPQISLQLRYVTKSVLRELVRFTGSYQVLNLMEMFYASVVPVILLRKFGAEAAGVFAICDRLTRFATTGLDSSLVPLLSGSSMIVGGGSLERMRAFLAKSFKLCLIATLIPLAFVSAFGPAAVLAWTGQSNNLFKFGVLLVAITAFFRSLSKVGMVLYRSTGGATMDTAAQLVRIAVLVVAVLIGRHWGFYGAVSGLVLAEFAGMTFMLEALFRRLKCFSLRQVFGNAAHLSISAVMLMVAGEMVRRIPLPFHAGSRTFVSAQLCIISLVVLALTWPAFVLTNYLTSEERTQAVKTLLPSRRLVVHRQQGS